METLQSSHNHRQSWRTAMATLSSVLAVIALSSGLLLIRPAGAEPSPGIIRQLLRENVAGVPVVHQNQDWPFDPDAALRRRPLYVSLHGDKSVALIERLGLGEDGRHEERRAQNAVRDAIPVPPEEDFRP